MGFFWRLFDRRKTHTPVIVDRRVRVTPGEAQERYENAIDEFGKAVALVLEQKGKRHVQSK